MDHGQARHLAVQVDTTCTELQRANKFNDAVVDDLWNVFLVYLLLLVLYIFAMRFFRRRHFHKEATVDDDDDEPRPQAKKSFKEVDGVWNRRLYIYLPGDGLLTVGEWDRNINVILSFFVVVAVIAPMGTLLTSLLDGILLMIVEDWTYGDSVIWLLHAFSMAPGQPDVCLPPTPSGFGLFVSLCVLLHVLVVQTFFIAIVCLGDFGVWASHTVPFLAHVSQTAHFLFLLCVVIPILIFFVSAPFGALVGSLHHRPFSQGMMFLVSALCTGGKWPLADNMKASTYRQLAAQCVSHIELGFISAIVLAVVQNHPSCLSVVEFLEGITVDPLAHHDQGDWPPPVGLLVMERFKPAPKLAKLSSVSELHKANAPMVIAHDLPGVEERPPNYMATGKYIGDWERPNSETLVPFTILRTEEDGDLGLTFSGPKNFVVESVAHDSFADFKGVQEEDKLVMLDGSLVARLPSSEVTRRLNDHCSLRLTFQRVVTEPQDMPPIRHVYMAVALLGKERQHLADQLQFHHIGRGREQIKKDAEKKHAEKKNADLISKPSATDESIEAAEDEVKALSREVSRTSLRVQALKTEYESLSGSVRVDDQHFDDQEPRSFSDLFSTSV